MKEKIKEIIQNKEIMKRIVPVLVLMLILVIGSTYAYFSINVSGGKTSTSISVETGNLNSIAITNKIPNIHINLKASDMSSTSLVTEFYATDKENLPYETYNNRILNIAEISVVGNIEVKNFCTADVTVAFTEGDSMGDVLLEGDSELYIEAGNLRETLDLSTIKNTRSQTYTANFEITNSEPHAIQAYLKINNRAADQSYLAGKELHLKIEINNFSCTTDVEAPTLANFYINESSSGTKYTKQTQNTAYLSWQEDDVKEYCITKDETNEQCSWETIPEGKNITKEITLDTPDGEKTLYAYLKDKANNTSESFTDKIILDTIAPTITDVTQESTTQTSITVSVTGSDANGIKQYCYGTNQNDYTCTDSSTHTFNSNLSAGAQYTFYFYLVDNAGNDNKASATQKQFTTESKPAKNIIIENSKSLESEEEMQIRNTQIKSSGGQVQDDLRRFVGTKDKVIDNFICFGTNNQETCKSNMDTYMYRIIGVDTSNRLKLIKATKIVKGNTNIFQWDDANNDTKWNASELYSGLNNGYFMKNTKYGYMQQAQWTSLISPVTYHIGDSKNTTNQQVFADERKERFDSGNISLMYLSDYLYASDANTNNWLFIQNGLNDQQNTPPGSAAPSAGAEWTMTRYGYNDVHYYAWDVGKGAAYNTGLTTTYAVRPVFYIDSSMIKLKGTGIIGDPYYITNV